MLEVVSPGLLTTIQDEGRPGFGHLGVPASGACDPAGFAVANALLRNPPGAAALELTLVGPELRAVEAIVVAIGGADLGAFTGDGRRLTPGASYRLNRGTTLAFPGPPTGAAGARAYLAVPGGVSVPPVLGSRSTCLVAGFGGYEGRPLRAGDVVRPVRPGAVLLEQRWPGGDPRAGPVRVVPGPVGGIDAILGGAWTVAADSDRMGIRLEGAGRPAAAGRSIVSHGVTWGSVQLPPDGRPIVLLADAQPTGGYPVVAAVIVADRPVLGQLRPGDGVRFEGTDEAAARGALAAARASFDAALEALADERRWQEAADAAGS